MCGTSHLLIQICSSRRTRPHVVRTCYERKAGMLFPDIAYSGVSALGEILESAENERDGSARGGVHGGSEILGGSEKSGLPIDVGGTW